MSVRARLLDRARAEGGAGRCLRRLLEHLEPRIGSELVVVLAASGAAPAALAFASRYPERTQALVVAMGVSCPVSLPSLPRVPGLEFLVWSLGTVFWRAFGARGVVRKLVPDATNRSDCSRMATPPTS